MSVLDALRATLLAAELGHSRRAYATRDPGVIHAVQLQLLNAEWERATRESPWFSRLKREGALPDRFPTLRDFAARVPVMGNVLPAEVARAVPCVTRRPDFYRASRHVSGGAANVPAWASERERAWADRRLAYERLGAPPGAGVFVLDLLPDVWPARLSSALREARHGLRERVHGRRHFALRALDPRAAGRAARALVRSDASVLTGPCAAIEAFAAMNAGRRDELRAHGIKLVVGDLATLDAAEDVHGAHALLGCPAALEYTPFGDGPVAHTAPGSDEFEVFWRTWLVEAEPVPAREGRWRLLVTSLHPRCFPLVRWDTGDVIEGADARALESGVLRFRP